MSFDWSTTDLPNPSIDYNGRIESSVIRTKMDSGRIRQRRRFTSGLRTLDVVWLFTDEQFALFQGVWHHKLFSGADFIDNFTLAIGESLAQYDEVRFVGDGYTHNYVPHMQWRVRAKIEIPNVSPLSEAEVDAALA